MRYERVVKGRFLSRPNRFIAHVEMEGRVEVCHVKNTVPGAAGAGGGSVSLRGGESAAKDML